MPTETLDKKKLFAGLRGWIDEILSAPHERDVKLNHICRLLADHVPYYDWVGFYRVEGSSKTLVLGPFVGAPTEHTRIPFGKGVCGQAAAVGKTVIIQDVSKVANYLSCAPDVQSEIVVPIFNTNGKIVGELDIDSHEISPFSYEDREFLEYVCRRLPAHVLSA